MPEYLDIGHWRRRTDVKRTGVTPFPLQWMWSPVRISAGWHQEGQPIPLHQKGNRLTQVYLLKWILKRRVRVCAWIPRQLSENCQRRRWMSWCSRPTWTSFRPRRSRRRVRDAAVPRRPCRAEVLAAPQPPSVHVTRVIGHPIRPIFSPGPSKLPVYILNTDVTQGRTVAAAATVRQSVGCESSSRSVLHCAVAAVIASQ